MNIKKVDDRPIIIHTKGKTKLHVKSAPEAKIKGRNVLVVDKNSKATGGTETEKNAARKNDCTVSGIKVKTSETGIRKMVIREKQKVAAEKKQEVRGNIGKPIQKRCSAYADRNKSVRNSKLDRKKSNDMKNHVVVNSLASAGAKAALEQMEGGGEVYEACIAAKSLSCPLESVADAGRKLYRTQTAKAERIKKVQMERNISKKAIKDNATKITKETTKAAARKVVKETSKTTVTMAGTVAGTATTGAGGVLIGTVAEEAMGRELDKQDMKKSTRNRMIQLFVSKLRQGENQDSVERALKDIAIMRFSFAMKYIVKYVGMFLLGMLALVALMVLPLIAVLAVIYNSPFAIFFPSISSEETTQEVLSAYLTEFNEDVNKELEQFAGYDKSEKVYVNFTGEGIPDNYCDILAVYMVKYGNGDTATDMTDKAKENLKKVFDDMCSYNISSGTEEEVDGEEIAITSTVKYVNVTLKTYKEMISVYRFNEEEQDILAELMKPENLALLGYGGPGSSGQDITPEQYQAVVDAISDANGKKVVEFALSKVGYPYSQELRDSGTHYDCSSLAFYAWKYAGVDISYQGSTTAASEGLLCYDNNWLVHYEEMHPGDLIFYSYSKNGRFLNITHVAIYAGNGMVVEAANERLGVVYRSVPGKGSIVLIGRPR